MAQQDTGLGWSAKEEWLISTAGLLLEFKEFGGSDFPGQPLPIISTIVDLRATGLYAGTSDWGGTYGDWYIGILDYEGKFSDCVAFGVYTSGNTYDVYFASSVGGDHSVLSQTYKQDGDWSGFMANQWAGANTYDNATGLYYARASNAIGLIEHGQAAQIPIFNSLRDGLDAIQVSSTPIYKTNPGYAVACYAKWQTDNDVLMTTPVLISSKSENVEMSFNSTSYNLAKLNIRYDGILFYMSFFDIVDKSMSSALQQADLSMFNLDLPQVFNLIAQSGMANILVTETVDPYEDFGNTGEGGGEVDPDPPDDDIEVDDLPTKSFASAGFCRIYNPDISDLNDLANYMWTDQNFLQTVINHLKQILENPIEAIISLSMVPVQPLVGPSKVPVNVMYINTGVSMRPVTNQFVSVDCGTAVLNEVYGGALDYNPYTRVQIYLPYIGTVQLDTDEVMGKTIHVTYHIDVVTGICCAEIEADNKLLYQFSGHCSVSQPITSADFSSYLNAAIAAAKVAVGIATGSAEVTAAAAAAQMPPEVSSPASASQSTALVPASGGGPIGPHLGSPNSHKWTDFSDIVSPRSGSSVAWGELAKPGNMNTVASTMGGKMVVQHSGGFSGNSGYLAKRRPYLIVVRPRIANPKNYAQHFGRTSMEYLNLGSCTGYTKVQSVHLSGFDATNPELSEISSLLKGGVLL